MIKKAKDAMNYILSEKPFPTYVYEDFFDEPYKLTVKMEKAYDKAYRLVDEANDELKDYADDIASEFETKENSADLDLARELFRIYIKEGYNYGFSMILEFDDIFIDGISKDERMKLENLIKSYAIALMKEIAAQTKMTLYGQKSNDSAKAIDEDTVEGLREKVKEIDKQLKEAAKENDEQRWYALMNQRNDHVRDIIKLERKETNKAQDSADIQIQIEINESIARELIKNVECNNEKVIFKIEGSDFRIIHSDPVYHYFDDYDPDTFNSDDFRKRIQPDGDLYEDVIRELKGEDANLMIWL